MKQIYILRIYFQKPIQIESKGHKKHGNKGVHDGKISKCVIDDEERQQQDGHIGQEYKFIQIEAIAFLVVIEQAGIDHIGRENEKVNRHHHRKHSTVCSPEGHAVHEQRLEMRNNHQNTQGDRKEVKKQCHGKCHLFQDLAFTH